MKKLKTTTNDTFNGLPILKLKGGLVLSYLDKLYDTIDKAVTQYPRTTAIRVDLRLAKSLLFDDYWCHQELYRFAGCSDSS